MHFYKSLIAILFPFVPLHEGRETPPENEKFVVNYQDIQVVTYNGDILVEKGD